MMSIKKDMKILYFNSLTVKDYVAPFQDEEEEIKLEINVLRKVGTLRHVRCKW